jgi:DNA-binding LacI/PurR family transcriptional regulator
LPVAHRWTNLRSIRASCSPDDHRRCHPGNVSKSVVSRVLQGEPHVTDVKREAVLRAISELGYSPNRAARALVQQRSHTVGALLSDIRVPWFVELLTAMRAELTGTGMSLFLSEDSPFDPDESILRAFVEARIDGLLIVGTIPSTTRIVEVASSLPTVVVAGREPDLPGVDIVAGDDFSGASAAVEHLIAPVTRESRISAVRVLRGRCGHRAIAPPCEPTGCRGT